MQKLSSAQPTMLVLLATFINGALGGATAAGADVRLAGCNCGCSHLLFSQVLSFGSWFDHTLGGVEFPDSLLTLDLGRDFNQPIDRILWPKRLARLTFGFFFNQSIEESLPSTLRYLSLGDCYNLPIGNVGFPPGLLEVSAREYNLECTLYRNARDKPVVSPRATERTVHTCDPGLASSRPGGLPYRLS